MISPTSCALWDVRPVTVVVGEVAQHFTRPGLNVLVSLRTEFTPLALVVASFEDPDAAHQYATHLATTNGWELEDRREDQAA